jgi:hypothetical protein
VIESRFFAGRDSHEDATGNKISENRLRLSHFFVNDWTRLSPSFLVRSGRLLVSLRGFTRRFFWIGIPSRASHAFGVFLLSGAFALGILVFALVFAHKAATVPYDSTDEPLLPE